MTAFSPDDSMFNQAATVALRILQFGLSLPPVQAGIHAIASLGAQAGFTWLVLRARGLANRMQQTFDSLLLTDMALTLLLLPPLSVLAPPMMRIAENPELAKTESLPALPALVVLA